MSYGNIHRKKLFLLGNDFSSSASEPSVKIDFKWPLNFDCNVIDLKVSCSKPVLISIMKVSRKTKRVLGVFKIYTDYIYAYV